MENNWLYEVILKHIPVPGEAEFIEPYSCTPDPYTTTVYVVSNAPVKAISIALGIKVYSEKLELISIRIMDKNVLIDKDILKRGIG